MNTQDKAPPLSPSAVTQAYNEKQDAIGLAMLRVWVPAERLPAIRCDMEHEKVDYLVNMADEAEAGDPRVKALASRNIAAPLTSKEIEALRAKAAASKVKDAEDIAADLEDRLAEHADAASACERNALQGRLAARGDDAGSQDEATRFFAKAVACGYLVRFLKTEIAALEGQL